MGKLAAGEAHVSPGLAAQMLRVMQTREAEGPQPIDDLTKREEDILKGVVAGKSNKEIARDLGVSDKTVRNQITGIFAKLGVSSRQEAILKMQNP